MRQEGPEAKHASQWTRYQEGPETKRASQWARYQEGPEAKHASDYITMKTPKYKRADKLSEEMFIFNNPMLPLYLLEMFLHWSYGYQYGLEDPVLGEERR